MMGIIIRALVVVTVTFVARKILEIVFDMIKANRERQNYYQYMQNMQNQENAGYNGQITNGEDVTNNNETSISADIENNNSEDT